MKKVVVTGGAGFIGSNLVDALVLKGYDVHIVDNLSEGKKENVNAKATLHVEDIRNLDGLKKIFAGATYVFHLAAMPRVQYSIDNPIETHNVNVTGTLNVLVAAADAKVKRVIFTSSSAVYGDQPTMPLIETMQPMPKSPYGAHKLIGEVYCKAWNTIYGLETVCLRYFNVYGPRFNPEGAYALVIGKFMKQRAENKPMTITGSGNQTRDFIHVADVAQANILAAESANVGKGEAFNIGSGKNLSINKIAELIGGPIEYIPARLEPTDTLSDNSYAQKMLGWSPKISIEEGIQSLKK